MACQRISLHTVIRFVVHFERDNEEGEEYPAGESHLPTIDAIMTELQHLQHRVLDQWCFTEHLDPDVLLQVCYHFLFKPLI